MRRKISINDCLKLAKDRGGQFLSNKYITAHIKYLWKCKYNHIWEASFSNVCYNKSWCPECSNHIPLTIEDCHVFAKGRGGMCLSSKYLNGKDKLKWQCDKGHVWESTFCHIKYDRSWCPKCGREITQKAVRLNINICHELAKQKGGRFLSEIYKTTNSIYKWQCANDHVWCTSLASIKNLKSWCPRCAKQTSKSEIEILEYVKVFYPDAQKGKNLLKNKRFELDVYVPSLNKAIEFDGDYWHNSEWAIKKGLKEREKRKDEECRERGIQLLRIVEKEFVNNKDEAFQKIINFMKNSQS